MWFILLLPFFLILLPSHRTKAAHLIQTCTFISWGVRYPWKHLFSLVTNLLWLLCAPLKHGFGVIGSKVFFSLQFSNVFEERCGYLVNNLATVKKMLRLDQHSPNIEQLLTLNHLCFRNVWLCLSENGLETSFQVKLINKERFCTDQPKTAEQKPFPLLFPMCLDHWRSLGRPSWISAETFAFIVNSPAASEPHVCFFTAMFQLIFWPSFTSVSCIIRVPTWTESTICRLRGIDLPRNESFRYARAKTKKVVTFQTNEQSEPVHWPVQYGCHD